MSEYTRFERRLARLLSSNPFIKAMLKKVYVVVMRLSAFGKSRISSDFKITPIFSLKESFFGYSEEEQQKINKEYRMDNHTVFISLTFVLGILVYFVFVS